MSPYCFKSLHSTQVSEKKEHAGTNGTQGHFILQVIVLILKHFQKLIYYLDGGSPILLYYITHPSTDAFAEELISSPFGWCARGHESSRFT